MAETSKNKIYYNDNENSVADVLADMKKMAESTDKAIENSKYNDAQIKKDISDAKKEQALKDAEQDNKIIELQNEKAKLEKELKEAQEDFYQNSIRGQASGEYIHVEDSSSCRGKIGISGNNEQKMRSGKNYLNTLAKYKSGEKVTVDGITYTFNEDGSITCNGTATEDSVLTFSSNLQIISGSSKKIVGMITGTQVPKKISILAYTSDWSKNTFELLSSVNKNITINMQENIDYAIFRIIAYKGTTLNNQTIYYQILDTSVNDLTYEQYGVMPSTDYLSEVKCVGSNVNEFDIDTVKDGFLNEKTGEIISNNSWKCSDFIEILHKTYTFGWESSSDYFQVNVCYYDENKKFLSGKSYGFRGTFNNTFEVVSNAKYMKIAYSVSVSGELVTREKIKLEKGTVATQWSQHGQGCVKVTKCNKNIMPILNLGNNYKYTENGIKSLKRNDGVEVTRFKVKKGQTIKFGLKLFSRPTQDTSWTIYFDNLGIASFAHLENSSSFDLNKVYEKTYTASEDGDIFIKLWGNASSDVFEFQLWAELNTLTDYVQHEEQSYIMPVQQEMLQGDYFDFDNEKEEHKWIKLIFDGTENWLQSGNTYPTFYISPYEITSKFGIPAGLKAFCNYFSQKSNIWGIDEIGFDTANLRQDYVDFRFCLGSSSTITTLEAWKKKLVEMHNSGKPLALYFQILNLNELDFTDEQKAVAKELNNARTYKNVTNITTDSKAILSLDYAKDQETQNQKMQNEIDEIKQLLSTTQTSAMLLDNLQKEVESEVE